MSRAKSLPPLWVRNLRSLMERQASNPRRLSLEARLNPTAVRDMLEGRTKFPRYDTVEALAAALGTTPAQLMGGKVMAEDIGEKDAEFGENLDLLTEIIARLQEVIEEHKRKLPPRDFAAMTATIYRHLQITGIAGKAHAALRPRIHDLLDYELLRQRKRR